MRRISKMTLKREVFLLSLAYSLVFSIVFVLIIGHLLFNSRLSQMKEKLHGSNVQIITYLDTQLGSSKQMLDYFERTLDLTSKNPLTQQRALAVFRAAKQSAPGIQSIFVGYSDGSLLLEDYDTPEEYRANDMPWYLEAAKEYPEVVIAFAYQEYVSGEWCFCSAKALADDTGEIAAVVALDFTVETLYLNAILQSDYNTQVNILIDENGVCVFHPDPSLIGTHIVNDLGGEPGMYEDEEGYIEYTLDGEYRIGYYHHITGSSSILVSTVNRSDVFVPALNGVINSVLGLVLLSVLMSTAFMLIFDHRYVKPVKLLKGRLSALLSGKNIPDIPAVYPNKELQEIAGSMEELTERTLTRKAKELSAILESSSDGILVLDRNDRILHYNAQFLTLWGLNRNTEYKTFGDLELGRRMIAESECRHPAKQVQEIEICFLKSGTILERYTRTLTELEHIEGILCVFRDVTQTVKKEEQLKEIANTDFLTGLNNRRYFAFLAAREFRKARENKEPLALLMIDIDNFKLINDTYGHDVGDAALKAFSAQLRQCSRKSDILGRYGGEEFCVLLPMTDGETASRIAERMRRHYAKTAIVHNGEKISRTISIGVAIADDQVSSVETLIKRADIACYEAKQKGRNCVEAFMHEMAKRTLKHTQE